MGVVSNIFVTSATITFYVGKLSEDCLNCPTFTNPGRKFPVVMLYVKEPGSEGFKFSSFHEQSSPLSSQTLSVHSACKSDSTA